MVDALDSKSGYRKVVGVRVPFRAQKTLNDIIKRFFILYGLHSSIPFNNPAQNFGKMYGGIFLVV